MFFINLGGHLLNDLANKPLVFNLLFPFPLAFSQPLLLLLILLLTVLLSCLLILIIELEHEDLLLELLIGGQGLEVRFEEHFGGHDVI